MKKYEKQHTARQKDFPGQSDEAGYVELSTGTPIDSDERDDHQCKIKRTAGGGTLSAKLDFGGDHCDVDHYTKHLCMGGGPQKGIRTLIKLHANQKQLKVKMIADSGELVKGKIITYKA